MKYLTMLLTTLAFWACSEKATKEDLDEGTSSSQLALSLSSWEIQISSSFNQSNSFRLWIVERPFSKISIAFDDIVADSVWLVINHSLPIEKSFQVNAYSCVTCTIQPALYGDFDFPDSTFLRGDTIRYRLAYTLDGKLDSTEWQEYVILGNHITYELNDDSILIQQFDSIQYPISLSPEDSCSKALLTFIEPNSVVDTFDYESNWDAIFSDGRTFIDEYELECEGEPYTHLFGRLILMSYEGDINKAAKSIQKISPRFFLNLVPHCQEYVHCDPVSPQ